jgi:hypothetical protein
LEASAAYGARHRAHRERAAVARLRYSVAMENDLNAVLPPENVKMSDKVEASIGSPFEPAHGFVAVLDALGAKNYSPREAEVFLQSRDEFFPFITTIAERQLKINVKDLKRFIFNDTVILAYVRGQTWQDAWAFCHILRAFETWFLGKQIFFRGAVGVGEFYRVDEDTNTIMGPAVTDAATWYERADWIGIHATPYATIFFDALLERARDKFQYVLVDYEVPFKDRGRMRLKAVNWPKGIFINNDYNLQQSKAAILRLLAKAPMPLGAEAKYFHAIEFYNKVETTQEFVKGRSPTPDSK